jgi:hypothetical protein
MNVKISRSRRRKRTVSARLVKDTLLVNAPASLSPERLETIIADFKVKFEKKRLQNDLDSQQDLSAIAAKLNARYFDDVVHIRSIEYVINQTSKFGCCDYRAGRIRISGRLGSMPTWVRDYVIIHEMAHLLEPNHSASFWNLVSRYKLAERARGYLIAVGLGQEEGHID